MSVACRVVTYRKSTEVESIISLLNYIQRDIRPIDKMAATFVQAGAEILHECRPKPQLRQRRRRQLLKEIA